MRCYQLGKILVGRDHEGFDPTSFFGAPSDSANDVIGFESVYYKDRDFEGGTDLFDLWDCGSEVFGHGFALGLVFWVKNMPGSWGRCVKGNSEVGWGLFFNDCKQGVRETINRGGVYSVRIRNRIANEGKVGTIDKRHAIK